MSSTKNKNVMQKYADSIFFRIFYLILKIVSFPFCSIENVEIKKPTCPNCKNKLNPFHLMKTIGWWQRFFFNGGLLLENYFPPLKCYHCHHKLIFYEFVQCGHRYRWIMLWTGFIAAGLLVVICIVLQLAFNFAGPTPSLKWYFIVLILLMVVPGVSLKLYFGNYLPLFFCDADSYATLYEDGNIIESNLLSNLPKFLGKWGDNKHIKALSNDIYSDKGE